MPSNSVLVLGHTGFFGKAIYSRLLGMGVSVVGASMSSGVDIRIKSSLTEVVRSEEFHTIINCAATVGGIEFGRKFPSNIFKDNLLMIINTLEVSAEFGIQLINPISNCTYPGKLHVYKEDEFWNGPLDDSVLVYGMVRKMGLVGTIAYNQQNKLKSTNLVFPNIFGPGDHLDVVRAHALGALVYRFLNAKKYNEDSVKIWGTGKPVREWMYIEDAVDAIISSISLDLGTDIINIGTGMGISIGDLARKIASVVGFEGVILFDESMQDGVLHKTMDGTKGKELLNWAPQTHFDEAITKTVEWYRNVLNASGS